LDTNVSLPLFRDPADTVDITEIFSLLKRRAWLISACVAGGAILALLYVLFAIPQFTATGALYLGDAQRAGGGGGNDQSNLGFSEDFASQSDVETQIELVTSKTLVQQALMETGLNAHVAAVGSRPLTFWQWRLRDGGQVSDYLPAPDALQVLYAEQPGVYRIVLGQNGSYQLLAKSGAFSKPDNPILKGVLGKPASGHGVQMLVQPRAQPFGGEPGESYEVKVVAPGAMADQLIGAALSVVAGGSAEQPTKIAFLQFHWNNPYEAANFLNAVMRDFMGTQLAWKTQSASTTEDFVAGQLDTVRKSLANADKNLAAYQSQTGIMNVPQNAQAAITSLSQYQTQRSTLQLQEEALQTLASELHQRDGTVNPYLVSQTNDTVLANLTTNLSDAQVKLTALQVQYQNTSQEVEVQQAQVNQLEQAIRVTVDNDLAGARRSLESLNELISGYQSQLKSMPSESLKVISLQRSSDVLGQLYVLLMEKEQEAEVSKAATILNTRVVTAADAPEIATSPKAAVSVLFGAFAGLVFGLSVVFGKRASSGRFESEGEIRKSIKLPIFGTVPRSLAMDSDRSKGMTLPLIGSAPWRAKADTETRLLGGERNRSFVEAFRLLRGAIYRNMTPGAPMIILVISALEGDGKTTVAANLAKALADDGRSVALVDGDSYKGRLQDKFKHNPAKKRGDTPEEMGQRDKFAVISLVDSVPGKTHNANYNATPPLSETALSHTFAALREKFEFIILDSPPLPSVADGMTLGIYADLILSVVSVSHTSRRSFAAHNELLALLNRPHGMVINLADWHESYSNAA
jgi:tyrosine-protein kinase Etk/Wzc